MADQEKPREIWVDVFGATNVGRISQENQDDFNVCDLERGCIGLRPENRHYRVGSRGALFLVADGVGGVQGGRVASRIASEIVVKRCLDSGWLAPVTAEDTSQIRRLQAAVAAAHQEIRRDANLHHMAHMSTTLTAALVTGANLIIVHVGDSRAYLCRGNHIEQLTRDHTVVQRLLELGEISSEEAAGHPQANMLSSALGLDREFFPDVLRVRLCRGDTLVLCTDGLYSDVTTAEIRDVVIAHMDLANVCQQLINRANERGGFDNITVLAVRLTGEDLPPLPEDLGVHLEWMSEKANS